MAYRRALEPYVKHPEKGDSINVVIRYTDQYTLIYDLYPKATIHLLLLPRSPARTSLHPFKALCPRVNKSNQSFYDSIASYVLDAKRLAVTLLEKKLNRKCTIDDIKAGIHALPSLSNLHIHIISVDNHSSRLKNKKHYNSFNTPFFIDFNDLESLSSHCLNQVAALEPTSYEKFLKLDLICWRCKKQFSNKFKLFQQHLNEEFEIWLQEKNIISTEDKQTLKHDVQ
ncbi:HIT-like domain-containing protein [Lipomyces oligophaga]|uniref:HIT-like domain-containing protein n=1 Tax=Lipomyces oligophaga TaxID=45792 RepID=UPI0034CE9A04